MFSAKVKDSPSETLYQAKAFYSDSVAFFKSLHIPAQIHAKV
jgi:hypothetical protein